MICSNCGKEIAEGNSFCANCGTKVLAIPETPKVEGWDYCPNCGEKIPMNSPYCGKCGAKITNPLPTIGTSERRMSAGEPQAFTQDFTPAPPKDVTRSTPAKKQGMKWFKFIIYAALFIGAAFNILCGIGYIMGLQYSAASSSAEAIYLHFPMISIVDKVYGVLLICLGCGALYTRFRLAKFMKDGPRCYFLLQIISIFVSVLYTLAVYIVLIQSGYNTFTVETLLSDFTSTIPAIIILIINTVYFQKRRHLFAN